MKNNKLYIDGKNEISFSGKFCTFANVRYSWGEEIINIDDLIEKCRKTADIITFSQKVYDSVPKYNYYYEIENFAILPVSTYNEWSYNQISKECRHKIKKSLNKGITVKIVDIDDEFIKGIVNIFNESPIRQGKPFPHYGKDFNSVKRDILKKIENSVFIGAYLDDELIGFVKLLCIGECARTVTICSMAEHFKKKPNNALIAKAVEVCEQRKISYLIYGNFFYGKRGNPTLAEFKQHLGFKKFDVPVYYIPLTLKGKLILRLKLHHGIIEVFPKFIIDFFILLRNKRYSNYN